MARVFRDTSSKSSTQGPTVRCDAPSLSASPSQRTGTTVGSYSSALSLQTPYCLTPSSLYNVGLQDLVGGVPIIAVMGPTGAGKSTFIKVATGSEEVHIGDSLTSCTQVSQAIRCHNTSRNCDVVLVDTPGFDDTVRSDLDILRGIADWLEETYRRGIQLSGILYLHRITDNRMTNTLLRNLDLFKKLCGDDTFSNIRFVTTSWDLLKEEEDGARVEEELRTNYWRPFLDRGSQLHRFEYTCSSAWKIINSLPMERRTMQIQSELVDQHKTLSQTTAGKSLFSWASEVLRDLIAGLEHLIRNLASSSSHRSRKKAHKRLRVAQESLSRIDSMRSHSFRSSIESNFSGDSDTSHSSSQFDASGDTGESSIRRHLSNLRRPHRIQTSAKDVQAMQPTGKIAVPQGPVCDFPDTDSLLEVATGADVLATGTLTCTIQTLKLARAVVAGLPIPGLTAAVGAALRVAELFNDMHDTDRSLVILINNVGGLIKTICDQSSPQGYPEEVNNAIKDFSRHIEKIEVLAKKIKRRGRLRRFALEPDDRRVVFDCNNTIKLALHSLGIRISLKVVAQNQDIMLKLAHLETLVTMMVAKSGEKQRRTL